MREMIPFKVFFDSSNGWPRQHNDSSCVQPKLSPALAMFFNLAASCNGTLCSNRSRIMYQINLSNFLNQILQKPRVRSGPVVGLLGSVQGLTLGPYAPRRAAGRSGGRASGLAAVERRGRRAGGGAAGLTNGRAGGRAGRRASGGGDGRCSFPKLSILPSRP